MAIKSDAESVKVLPSDNQNITSEAPKLLLCSSIASGSDLGSNEGVTPLAGIGKEYPELSWYYLYLSNKELKRYISVFSGRKAVRFRTLSGSVEEEFSVSKCFPIQLPIIGNVLSNVLILRRNILPAVTQPGW